MIIRNATLLDGTCADIRLHEATIVAVASTLRARPGEMGLDAAGGVLLPGLQDHHIHLLSLAAALSSFNCGTASSAEQFAQGLRRFADGKASLRATGYHENIAGAIDRAWLDAIIPEIPVRIQHRSGRLWYLNSAALRKTGHGSHTPLEVQDDVPTGRLYDADEWLRERWPMALPELSTVGYHLARRGVTGVTDATPSNGNDFLAVIRAAQARGDIPQRVHVMGTSAVTAAQPSENLAPLAIKIHLHEGDYPSPDSFHAMLKAARAAGLTLATHCVTEADLIFTISLLEEADDIAGARIEHGSLIPPDMLARLAHAGVTVVTQPNFIAERGDEYLQDVPQRDHANLYRCATLKSAGIKLGGGTDAPFGHWDPWAAMHAATNRRTRAGAIIGPMDLLSPEDALAMFTTRPADPGGAPRLVAEGESADLCLLREPWSVARARLDTVTVRATLRRGRVIYDRHEENHKARNVA